MGNASAGGLAYVTQGGAGGGVDVVIGGNTAGATASVSSGTLFLAGGNNVTLSQNGQSVTISGGAAGGATSAGVYATGNTTNNSSSTLALSSQLFNFQGGITGGLSNGSIQISAPGVSSLSNSNNVSFGTNGSTITASASFSQSNQQMTVFATGNTTQASTNTTNASSLIFAGSGGISMGVSGGTILASGIVAAGTGFTAGINANAKFTATNNTAGLSVAYPCLTRMIWPDPEQGFTQISAPGNASLTIRYLRADVEVTASRLDALVAMSFNSSAAAATAGLVLSAYAIVYTRNVSTLSSLSSGSTQTTYTYASNTAGNTQLTNSAIYPISVPININMAPGEYFIGFNMITNSTSSALGATISMVGASQMQTALNYAEITANTATSSGLFYGMGVYTAATTGIPVSIGLSNIAQTGASLAQANIAIVLRDG
jgi:hypothetical protein